MTVQEMHIAFKLELDKTDNLEYPGYRPEEIDYWLNRSITEIIKQRFTGNNTRRESVEETEKRRDDLRNITKDYNISVFTSSIANKPNGVFVALPSDYYFALSEEASIAYPDCHGNETEDRVPVRAITHDRYNKMIRDPFNKPDKTEIFSLPYEGSTNEIIVGNSTTTLSAYYLRYIRKPATVSLQGNISCDLSEQLHPEIVIYAANMAIENIESPRVVTQTQQLTRNE